MNRLTLPVDVEWKATTSPGEVEGYASVFGVVDKVGDVVLPGAFRKTIGDWRHASQPLPLTADHNVTTDGLIGSIADLREDAHGLKFKARFSRSDKAQRIRQDIIDGHLRGTSFIYEAIIAKAGRFEGKAVRFLHELRLHEITVAMGPLTVNEMAGVTSAKATDLAAESKAAEAMAAWQEWHESMTHALGIGNELARKAAVDELVRAYPQDLVAATGDAPGTTTDAAGDDAGTSTDDTTAPAPDDAYAVGFLHKNGPPDEAPNGEPPAALPGRLADLENERITAQIDALEAELISRSTEP